MGALSVNAIMPMMKRALNSFAGDRGAAQISTEVRTMSIEDGHFTAGGAEGDEAFAQDRLGNRTAVQFALRAKEIPGSGLSGKAGAGWSLAREFQVIRPWFHVAVAMSKSAPLMERGNGSG